MIQSTEVSVFKDAESDENDNMDKTSLDNYSIPAEVEVFQISGPLFFGAAYKFKDAIKLIERPKKIIIIRMPHVPIIDATGIRTLQEVFNSSAHRGTTMILSEVNSRQVYEEIKKSGMLYSIGEMNICDSFENALLRANFLLNIQTEH